MTRPRATVCEVLVSAEAAAEVGSLLRAAGFTAASGDPQDDEGLVRVPVQTALEWTHRNDMTAEALVAEHRAQVDLALNSAGVSHQVSRCWILGPRDQAQWLEVVRTDSLTLAGNRILAASEDDVDIQLAAFAALLGEPRDNFTVLPVAGWDQCQGD